MCKLYYMPTDYVNNNAVMFKRKSSVIYYTY